MNNHLAESKEQVSRNVLASHRYRTVTPPQLKFHDGSIKNAKLFVVLRQAGACKFPPNKFSGYNYDTTEHLNIPDKPCPAHAYLGGKLIMQGF